MRHLSYRVDSTRFRKGFTLIELLIVIAIIAILAAILFPVFNTAREKARQSSCSSNLKQIGLAMLQYSQDYDEMMPYAQLGIGTGEFKVYWQDLIYPYVKATGIFNCPDTDANMGVNPFALTGNLINDAAGRGQGGGSAPGGWAASIGSYVVNSGYWGSPGNCPIPIAVSAGSNKITPTQINLLAAPSSTLFCMDGADVTATGYTNAIFVTWQYNANRATVVTSGKVPCVKGDSGSTAGSGGAKNSNDPGSAVAWHTGRINVSWCDGHVGSLTADQMITPASASTVLKYWTVADD